MKVRASPEYWEKGKRSMQQIPHPIKLSSTFQAARSTTWDALKADTFRQYGEFSWDRVVRGAITRRTFRAIVTLRLCQALAPKHRLRFLFLPLKRFHRWATYRACIDLAWDTKIGPGITLTHGWGLVVSPGAKIGSNVTLFHGVTLGRRDRISADGSRQIEYPVIEDDVWIGPHAIIVGGVTVGRGSRIAGGAFVTENVPSHSIVSGNPAAVVKTNCICDVMNPAPL